MNTPNRLARIAGVLYLALAAFGMFAHLFARGAVHVPGDAAATAHNIVANATLFRGALAADLVMATVFVFLGLALYRLLAHVHKDVARAMVVFVCVGAGLILANLVFHAAAATVATNPQLVSTFGAEGSDGLALLFLDMHQLGYTVAGIFFGLWLLPLGYLAYNSGMFPRALGIVLMVACFTYIADTVIRFLMPDLSPIVYEVLAAPSAIAEFWMMGYLVLIGVRVPRLGLDARVAA